ncbi:hypothetical protein MKW92_025195, partial [Papaver armeniacum]
EYFSPDENRGGYLDFFCDNFFSMPEQAATPTPYNAAVVSLMSWLSISPTSSNTQQSLRKLPHRQHLLLVFSFDQ